jgi:hypothetical protein
MSEDSPFRPRRGRHATVVPYVRGQSPRDELLRWWLLMEEHGGQQELFWSAPGRLEAQRGDPLAFAEAFSRRLACACYDHASEQLIGFTWVERLHPRHHGHFGMYFIPYTTTAVRREATSLMTTAIFTVVTTLPCLFAMTPWDWALAHWLALGWQQVATLPGFAVVDDQCRDLYVLRLERP